MRRVSSMLRNSSSIASRLSGREKLINPRRFSSSIQRCWSLCIIWNTGVLDIVEWIINWVLPDRYLLVDRPRCFGTLLCCLWFHLTIAWRFRMLGMAVFQIIGYPAESLIKFPFKTILLLEVTVRWCNRFSSIMRNKPRFLQFHDVSIFGINYLWFRLMAMSSLHMFSIKFDIIVVGRRVGNGCRIISLRNWWKPLARTTIGPLSPAGVSYKIWRYI